MGLGGANLNKLLQVCQLNYSISHLINSILKNIKIEKPKLSVIIPIKAESFEFYRHRLMLRDEVEKSFVETLIVDDGSPVNVSLQIKKFCEERDYRYIKLITEEKIFSLSRSRNAGIHAAAAEYVYMDDADLFYKKDFFQQVIHQLSILQNTPFNFLCFPAIYLKESVSNKILGKGSINKYYYSVIQAALLENPKGGPANKYIESYAPASGVVALKKELAFDVGLYDEQFEGWGGEDRDFIFRLIAVNSNIEFPKSIRITKESNLNDIIFYEGWRSLFRIYGEFSARQGLYAIHLFHQEKAWRNNYKTIKNMRLAARKAKNSFVVDHGSIDFPNIKSSILFGAYKAADTLFGSHSTNVDYNGYALKSNAINLFNNRKSKNFRKIIKFLKSPVQFMGDSSIVLFRMVGRYFDK